MLQRKQVYIFIGTTAELIKLAPVIQEFKRRRIVFTIIASRQNDIRFEEFTSMLGKVKILYAVHPKSNSSSIFWFAFWAVRTFFSLLVGLRFRFQFLDKSNSFFIVHGDTVSSLMGTLVAKIYGLKLVHIESGLRSFNFFEPFPEEACRFIISRLADIHFCPNSWCVNNLKNVHGEKINTFQNTLIETFLHVLKSQSNHRLVHTMKRSKQRYFVLVTHRQEHVVFGQQRTRDILKFVLSKAPKNLRCLFLVHDLSNDFMNSLRPVISASEDKNMISVGRLPYGDFMHLLMGAQFMITDGGSNQEEMYYMGKPCLLLRNTTERIEGLGENVVLSKNKKRVISNFIKHYKTFRRPSIQPLKKPSKIITNYLFPYAT